MKIKFFCFWIFLLAFHVGIFGQSVGLLYPHFRQIFQRNPLNEATFSVLGNCNENSTLVQYKLVPVEKGQGVAVDWSNLDEAPGGGFFQGKIKAKGGWYALWVRSMGANKVWQDSTVLSRVGVGENFIIAGQSNAQGTKRKPNEKGASDDRVNCANFYNFIPEYNTNPTHKVFGERNLEFPFDNFTKLDDNATIGPTGLSQYYWPILGDSLVKKLNVPVCFYNASWFGTTMKNWLESAKGIPSKNPWIYIPTYYPDGFPYINLKKVAEAFGIKGGVRSILWAQGETDTNFGTIGADYYSQFKELVSIFRSQTGLDIPWVIAELSFTSNRYDIGGCLPPRWNPSIIKAQQDMISVSQISEMYSGPNFDGIEVPRKDDLYSLCVHFTPNAYSQVANAWLDKLNDDFFKTSKAILPTPLPQFIKKCGPNNDVIMSINDVPENTQIEWYNGNFDFIGKDKTKQLFTPGKYFLRTVDPKGNIFIVPFFQVRNLPVPAAPLLTSVGKLEFCDGESVTLKLSNTDQSIVWNTGENSTQIPVKETGVFKAVTKNKYGCVSNYSNEIKTIKFLKPLLPIITTNNSINFCDGESINLSVQVKSSKYTWNNGSDQQTINVKSSGDFNVFVTNDLGCNSDISKNIKVTVFQNPSSPIVNLLSPYFLTGGQKTSDIDFIWSLNNVAITSEKGSNLRVKTSGRYSVYASKKYTDGPTCVSPTIDLSYSLPQDGGLSMFPNPAGNLVTIQSISSLQGSEFTIYAMDGRQITQGKITQDGSYEMNLAGINAGNYKLVLKTNDQVYTKTLIISN